MSYTVEDPFNTKECNDKDPHHNYNGTKEQYFWNHFENDWWMINKTLEHLKSLSI